jgi:hypothetical protein
VLVSSKNKQISIASLGGLIDKVMIFDTAKRLYEKVNVESQELEVLSLILRSKCCLSRSYWQTEHQLLKDNLLKC